MIMLMYQKGEGEPRSKNDSRSERILETLFMEGAARARRCKITLVGSQKHFLLKKVKARKLKKYLVQKKRIQQKK